MKHKLTIILICLLTIVVFLFLYIMKCHRKLPELTNYTIVSNNGKKVPAKLYSRTISSKVNGKEQAVYELILCFNDSIISNELNISGDDKVYKYLVIVPNLKMIGLVNKMNSLEEKEGYLCQLDDEADYFTSIINNQTFFNNPPVKEVKFTDNKIVFNTYGILKQFGESIIIETK